MRYNAPPRGPCGRVEPRPCAVRHLSRQHRDRAARLLVKVPRQQQCGDGVDLGWESRRLRRLSLARGLAKTRHLRLPLPVGLRWWVRGVPRGCDMRAARTGPDGGQVGQITCAAPVFAARRGHGRSRAVDRPWPSLCHRLHPPMGSRWWVRGVLCGCVVRKRALGAGTHAARTGSDGPSPVEAGGGRWPTKNAPLVMAGHDQGIIFVRGGRCSAVGVRSRAPTYDDTLLTRQGHQRRRDPVVAEQPQRYVREYTVVARRPGDGAIRRPRHLGSQRTSWWCRANAWERSRFKRI